MVTKNITLRLDEILLKECRYEAINHNQSLSKWVSELMIKEIKHNRFYKKAKKRALNRLDKGFHLKGTPVKRGDIYDR